MLKKLTLKSGVNRENTRYTNEGGWFSSDKVRFRQGTPEVIGGWRRINTGTFLGICRSLFTWVTYEALKLIGVGTHLKFYIIANETYYDITPLRDRSTTETLTNPFTTTATSGAVTVTDNAHGLTGGDIVGFTGAVDVGGIPAIALNTNHTVTSVTDVNNYVITLTDLATSSTTGGGSVVATNTYATTTLGTDPFATVNGSPTVTVTAVSHGAIANDYVTFAGASAVAGLTLNATYQVTSVLGADSYTITAGSNANATTTGGGAAVTTVYEINTGPEIQIPTSGWGAGYFGSGTWGNSSTYNGPLVRVWSQANYGEDLIFGPRYGGIYYWDATSSVSTRGFNLAYAAGASYVPTVQLVLMVSDASRFVIAFGCNDLNTSAPDPMLIRWSDQEDAYNWYPQITNQAGSYKLSIGSEIYAAIQTRQEILIWTDAALYSMQFLGAPEVWGFNILEGNTSCSSPNAVATAAGVSYWMGRDKFYKYDGRVQTLRCDLKSYIFKDINQQQILQTFAGTNEGFNEIWWFYCSSGSEEIDRYVVYNYLEDIWYYGTMGRTAWLDNGLNTAPLGATYNQNVVVHETGVDDDETGTPAAINASITSAEFDIDDGHNFSFIWRLLPDITFDGSSTTGDTPSVTFTLNPMQNSGSGYNVPPSVAASASGAVSRVGSYEVDQFTGQIYPRVRGRQMSISISSNTIGTTWQLGTPRIDVRPDGRR